MSEEKRICETCGFWGQSSGEFGVCLGPEPAERAARTDTCDDWKSREGPKEDESS